MGASTGKVVQLLSMEYLGLVLISFITASLLSYLIISWWLRNFSYKTDIGILSFLTGGVLAVIITALSVGFQSFKAALQNPVDSLKAE